MYVMEMNLEDIIAEKDEKDQRLLMAEFRNLGGYETIGEFFEDLENIRSLKISSEEHAKYLIKALNKAIELGWFE